MKKCLHNAAHFITYKVSSEYENTYILKIYVTVRHLKPAYFNFWLFIRAR